MSEDEFDKQLSWFEVPSEHEGLSVKLIEVIEGITI
jgi:hypothetical protein